MTEKQNVEKLDFVVPSIHCEGCVQVIRDALSRLPEVVDVEGEAKEKHITISVKNGSLSRAELADQIARLGHVVE